MPLLDVEVTFGKEQTREVHVIGARAADVKLAVREPAPADLDIEILPPSGSAHAGGLRIHVRGARVGRWVGNILVSTGIEQPREIVLPYRVNVTGTLEIAPTNPYFDLNQPIPIARYVDVRSTQPDFALLALEVQGPFTARVEAGDAGLHQRVYVEVDESRLDPESRGANGQLVIRSNDRTEPERVVPLFALGRPHSDGASRMQNDSSDARRRLAH